MLYNMCEREVLPYMTNTPTQNKDEKCPFIC